MTHDQDFRDRNIMMLKNGEWVKSEPLPCPSLLAVKWEAFTDYIKGIFK